jgi:hypothetical protein
VNFLGVFNVFKSDREIVLFPVTTFINHSSWQSIDPQFSSPIMMEHHPIKLRWSSFDTDRRRSRDKSPSWFTFSEDDRYYVLAHRDDEDGLIT